MSRLKGTGPALVVVPEGKTPFEAYQLLREPMRPQQTAEGMFEWIVRSKAYAEKDWTKAEPWNPPTSEMLAPKAKRRIGLRFLVSDRIQTIEDTLGRDKRPVAVGIPGYVLPRDIEGKLFVKAPSRITDVSVEPRGAIRVFPLSGSSNKRWQSFAVQGNGWGRSRLTLTYADGSQQTIQYYVTKPAAEAVSDLGRFLYSKQWFDKPDDPFGRSPSVMTYDRETDRIVDQDTRVWISGLGDEGGSGSWLAAAMKEYVKPDRDEVAKLERFIDLVLWGGLQYGEGPNKYGVRKSLFFYGPKEEPDYRYDPSGNWTTWTSWKPDQAESVGRGYNYPHVVAAYWSMYHIGRTQPTMLATHTWDWYLDQAFQTTRFAFSRDEKGKRRVGYVELGLMDGTIFLELLKDLKREGWTDKAAEVERLMKERADEWSKEAYPFGSEMAWDSTGQEEVYNWCKYFGYGDKAEVSLNSIVGYMPLIPHWGYNGNARRYWDFLYAAKLRRIERQLHHYGSGLNAIPMLDHYREHPDDLYYLRVGYAGGNAALSNIDASGFASAAFHSYPDTLKWDGYSGDYGMNFFGHAMNAATYLIKHPEFGWQAFGGNVSEAGSVIRVKPLDSMMRRVYVAPYGLLITVDSGTIEDFSVAKNGRDGTVELQLKSTGNVIPLVIDRPAKVGPAGTYRPAEDLPVERGAFQVPVRNGTASIKLVLHK